ncbi:hypothetical protein HDE_12239 [Halotydeus destructor]|nr:hypothetical protein HDE_12239 [Halotydeus destructor]
MSKFSVEVALAVQVDKLCKELEETKAREEQLSKLADDMMQVFDNHQQEVNKSTAEMRKQLEIYKSRVKEIKCQETSGGCSSPCSSEVASSETRATQTENNMALDSENIVAADGSRLGIFLHMVQSIALRNVTLMSLLDSGNLPPPLQSRLSWFVRPSRLSIPSEYTKVAIWIKERLQLAKEWLKTDPQKVYQLNHFETEVLDLMATVFGDHFPVQEVDAAEPPYKKVKVVSPDVYYCERDSIEYETIVSESRLQEMSNVVMQDETIAGLCEQSATLPKATLDAIDWLRNPFRDASSSEHRAENVCQAICQKIFVLSEFCERDRKKLLICRNRLTAIFRKKRELDKN